MYSKLVFQTTADLHKKINWCLENDSQNPYFANDNRQYPQYLRNWFRKSTLTYYMNNYFKNMLQTNSWHDITNLSVTRYMWYMTEFAFTNRCPSIPDMLQNTNWNLAINYIQNGCNSIEKSIKCAMMLYGSLSMFKIICFIWFVLTTLIDLDKNRHLQEQMNPMHQDVVVKHILGCNKYLRKNEDFWFRQSWLQYSDVIMRIMASQITSDSNVWLDVHQRKHQRFASLVLCKGNPAVTGGFPKHDVYHDLSYQGRGLMAAV